MSDKYILAGHTPVPCDDLHEWAKAYEANDRRVAWTALEKFDVSTVFLGIDHNFGGDGPPILFETMVFRAGESSDIDMDRYSTWEEAEAGHAKMVEKVLNLTA